MSANTVDLPAPAGVEASVPAANSSAPPQCHGSGFDLAAAIEKYISLRDEFWFPLVKKEIIGGYEIGILKVCNDALRQMLTLTPGPTTPVLSPARARIELDRVNVCAVFIARVLLENDARKNNPPAGTGNAEKFTAAVRDRQPLPFTGGDDIMPPGHL